MIRELKITDPELTPVEWWPNIEAMKGRESIEFAPGLTIIWGPNGVGKSSIIKALAMLTHCEQGGTPKVTDHSVGKIRRWEGGKNTVLDGMSLVTDGQPTHYMAPDLNPGLMYGLAAFDYDFMGEAMEGMGAMKTSSGEQVQRRLSILMQSVTTLTEVKGKKNRDAAALAGLEATPGVELGRKTILLDEPLRSVDLDMQIKLWTGFQRTIFRDYQVIMASHSMFSMAIKGATYIDLKPDYRDRCKIMIDMYTAQHGVPWAWPPKKRGDLNDEATPEAST